MEGTISRDERRRCQVFAMSQMAESRERAESAGQPLRHRLRLILRRSFSPSTKRKIKRYLHRAITLLSGASTRKETEQAVPGEAVEFALGEKIRVRSREQIQQTLDSWNELKGCSFLPEMWQYCGSVQTVLKPLRRIVDERDYRVKRVRHTYLLEGVNCKGFELYGECDRNCFYFWREEWLEKTVE